MKVPPCAPAAPLQGDDHSLKDRQDFRYMQSSYPTFPWLLRHFTYEGELLSCLRFKRCGIPIVKNRSLWQLDSIVLDQWKALDDFLTRAYHTLYVRGGVFLPFDAFVGNFPSHVPYQTSHETEKAARDCAWSALRNFSYLMAACSFVISWFRDLDQLETAWTKLLLAEGFAPALVQQLRNSEVGTFCRSVLRVGCIVKVDEDCLPYVERLQAAQVPFWIEWGYCERTGNRRFGPIPDFVVASAFVNRYYPSDQEIWYAVQEVLKPQSVQAPPISLPKPERGSKQLPEETWRQFFQRQNKKHQQQIASESAQARQTRLQHAEHASKQHVPGRKGAAVFTWECDPDTDFRVRTACSKDRAGLIWSNYSAFQRRYNEFDDEWDICTELDDQPADDSEDDDDLPIGPCIPAATFNVSLVRHLARPCTPVPHVGRSISLPASVDSSPSRVASLPTRVSPIVAAASPSAPPTAAPVSAPSPGAPAAAPVTPLPVRTPPVTSLALVVPPSVTSLPTRISATTDRAPEDHSSQPDSTIAVDTGGIFGTVDLEPGPPGPAVQSFENILYYRYGFLWSPSSTNQTTSGQPADLGQIKKWFGEMAAPMDSSDGLRRAVTVFAEGFLGNTSHANGLKDLCDLGDGSLKTLYESNSTVTFDRLYGRLTRLRGGIEPRDYYFIRPRTSTPASYSVILHEPEAALQVIRSGWGPNVGDIAVHLMSAGIRFTTAARHDTAAYRPVSSPSIGLGFQPFQTVEYAPTLLDYGEYIQQRERILQCDYGRAALTKGGIIAQIARDVLGDRAEVII